MCKHKYFFKRHITLFVKNHLIIATAIKPNNSMCSNSNFKWMNDYHIITYSLFKQ